MVKTAVIAKYSSGESKAQIAKDLSIAPHTVRTILNDSELTSMIQMGRSDCVQMIPRSVRVIGARLAKGSETAALAILRGTQVLQNQPVATTTNNIQANTWITMRSQRQAEEKQVIECVSSDAPSDNEAM